MEQSLRAASGGCLEGERVAQLRLGKILVTAYKKNEIRSVKSVNLTLRKGCYW